MTDVHLDHPGEITWFKGHGPAPVLGECPHSRCRHDGLGDIAWGPDNDHYALVMCVVPAVEGGCNKTCRAWVAEYPREEAETLGVKPFDVGPFKHVDVTKEAPVNQPTK